MALAYVLWISAMLSLLVAGFQSAVRTEVMLARRQVAEAEAAALAEGGLNLAIAEIAATSPEKVTLGQRTVLIAGRKVEVEVGDLGGLIDLNHAPRELLERLFLTAGVDSIAAKALADGIVARRDAWRPLSSSGYDAISAGSDARAGDQPFVLVEQIAGLAALPPATLDRLADALTVHSGSQIVDPAIAPPAAILALSGGDLGLARRYLERRATAGRLAEFDASAASTVIGAGFEIEARASTAAGRVISRSATVKPQPFAAEGLPLIVDWQAAERR